MTLAVCVALGACSSREDRIASGLRKAAGRYKGMREGKHQITVSRYLTCPTTVISSPMT